MTEREFMNNRRFPLPLQLLDELEGLIQDGWEVRTCAWLMQSYVCRLRHVRKDSHLTIMYFPGLSKYEIRRRSTVIKSVSINVSGLDSALHQY